MASIENRQLLILRYFPADLFYLQMQEQLELYKIRIMKLVCRCQHLGNCTMTPLSSHYTTSELLLIASTMSSHLHAVDGRWVLGGDNFGIPALDPVVYAFFSDIVPLLVKYSSTLNPDALDTIRTRFTRCSCGWHASGELCEIINSTL